MSIAHQPGSARIFGSGVLCFVLTAMLAATAQAATKHWNGSASDLWSNAANWDEGALADGDDLIFPAGQGNPSNTNDTSFNFNSILFNGAGGGYILGGAGFSLGTGITDSAAGAHTNTVNFASSLFMASGQSISCNAGTLNVDCGIRSASLPRSLLVGGAGDVGIGGNISVVGEDFLLAYNGSGTLTLSGAANVLSGITVSSGTVKQGVANAFGNGALSLAPGATADLNGFNAQVLTVIGTGTVTNSAATLATFTVNSSCTFGGTIAGASLQLTYTGSGTLTLTGTNSYGGATTVGNGIVAVGVVNALPLGTAVSLSPAAALDLNGFNQQVGSVTGAGTVTNSVGTAAAFVVNNGTAETFDGTLTGGSLSLTKSGGGTLTLTGSSTYGGSTTVGSGTLQLGVANALPAGTALSVGGTVELNAWDQQVAGVTGSGTVTNSGAAATFTVNNGAADTFGGRLTGANLSLAKTGAGTLTLTNGGNTFGGRTTVNAGTLAVNGSNASSAVTVNSGGILAGSGTVGSVTVPSGQAGGLSPSAGGVATAVLQTAAVSLSAACTYTVDLNGTGPVSARINAPGQTVALGGSTLTVSSILNPAVGAVYTIVSAGTVSGTFSGQPDGSTLNQAGRRFQVHYSATAVTLTDILTPPVITSATTATGMVGQPFSYQITATNSPAAFGATGLPFWAVVNTSTGVISGMPNAAASTNATISATNAAGTGSAGLAITVSIPPPPVITSATTANGAINQPFSYQITATNLPARFGAAGLPSWASVNTSTGAITGTPNATGTTNVTISATNAGGAGTGPLTIIITLSGGGNAAPVITSASSASATAGTPFRYRITAENSPTSFNATGLPPGLAVNTGSGLISGTVPNWYNAGAYVVTLSASNAAGTGFATLNLAVVQPPWLPSNPRASPNPASVNQPVTFFAAANNAYGYTLAYTWDFGDATSGTGSTVQHTYTAVGQYACTVTVDDGHGNIASGGVSVAVVSERVALSDQRTSETVQNGSVVYVVSNNMPKLLASFLSQTSTSVANCGLAVSYTYRLPKGKSKTFTLKLPKSRAFTLASGGQWDIAASLGATLCGGDAVFTYEVPGAPQLSGKLAFRIAGINPSQTEVDAYVDKAASDSEEKKMLMVIIARVSAYEQFSTGNNPIEDPAKNPITGYPLISTDGVGVGLGGLATPYGVALSQRDHWDWQYNCRRALQTLRSKIQLSRKQAKPGPAQTVEQDRINIYQLYSGSFAFALNKNTKQWAPTNSSSFGSDCYAEEVARFGAPAAKPAALKPVREK